MRKKIVKIIFIYEAEVRINSFFSTFSKLLGEMSAKFEEPRLHSWPVGDINDVIFSWLVAGMFQRWDLLATREKSFRSTSANLDTL